MKDEDKFNSVIGSITADTLFSKKIRNALLECSTEKFNNAYDEYENHLIENESSLSEQQQILALTKKVASELFAFTRDKKFREDNVLDYIQTIEEKVTPKLFAFVLWNQGKKDACFTIFKERDVDFTEKELEALYIVLAAHRESNNLPIAIPDRKIFIETERSEFLFYQNKFKLFKDLSELPTNFNTSKKPKI
jgi:aspartokinase